MSGAAPRARRLLPKALLALAALALAGVLLALFSGPAEAATFTVNRIGDASDRNINNSVCDVSRTRGNQCTLRAAIQEANNTPGADVIRFNIGSTASVKTISPASPLPDITEAVTINGYTQRGARANTLAEGNDAVLKVQLNGTNAGAGAEGLVIEASDSTIKGLVINRFAGNGVELGGKGGNKVEGNFIGTNASGTQALGNNSSGVVISGASQNTIGGTAAAARNIISGNACCFIGDSGVLISGSRATGNKVEGNFIGTDKSGTQALGNLGGVRVFGASQNTIGGTAAGARNIISGNETSGVILVVGATENKVEGNFIGTDASGTQDLGNDFDGVVVSGASQNTIGGTAAAARNIISGNANDGVAIFGSDATGNRVLSNSIFSNGGLGIDLVGGTEDSFGVTANDEDAPDTGANNLQNFPVITSVIQSSFILNPTRISGTLNSTPSQNFTVQCFLASETPEEADPSGHGEGEFFMEEDTTVTTDNDGNASFECDFPFPASLEGKRWSATATDEDGNTSEFSANFPAG